MTHSSKTPTLQQVLALAESGRLDEAERLCNLLCKANPRDANAMVTMAMIHDRRGQPAETEKWLLKALAMDPNLGIAHFNLGRVRAMRGDYSGAAQSFTQAQRLNPQVLDTYVLLGEVYSRMNDTAGAVEQLRAAARIAPTRADIRYRLALALYQDERVADAIEALHEALAMHPRLADAYRLLYFIHYEEGRYEEARDSYGKLLSFARDDGAQIRHATMAPIIMRSEEEIDEFRESMMRNIDALLEETLRVNNPVEEIRHTNFQLAYHGRNDRVLQTRLAELYLHACPSLAYESPGIESTLKDIGHRRIRIGFISNYLGKHSIGKAARGLIAKLPRDRFQVTAFFLNKPGDSVARFIEEKADRSVIVGNDLAEARRRIEEEKVDILFYQDIGMEPVTYFLAFSRLAPVQCTYFGHPVTTGIPNMDYFISTDMHEPPEMEDHYSERLKLLRGVAAPSYCYRRDVPPLDTSHDRFGFGADEHLYFCPQTLYKFHPAIDKLFADILRSDPAGRIVLKVGPRPYLAELLKRRFEENIPDVASGVTFMPQLSQQDYFSMVALADVMLDTIHFGGFTTTIDAISVGTPVITWPGEFMRGRHSMSFYRRMGIGECIADDLEDYARKAVALATDAELNRHVRERTLENSTMIWEEERVIEEFARVFEEMVQNIEPRHR